MSPDTLLDRVLPLRAGADTAAPLYCVPPTSGSPYGYLPLTAVLDQAQPAFALAAPGFEDDEPPRDRIADLSRDHLAAIAQHHGEGPACLLGWSSGGVVAYDMARRRAALGLPVPTLILVDAPVPPRESRRIPAESHVLTRFVADLVGVSALEELEKLLALMPQPLRIDEAFDVLAKDGIIPADLDRETLGRQYAVFYAGTQALVDYQAEAGYQGRVLVLRAKRTPVLQPGRWEDLAPQAQEHLISGDHYSLWRDEGLVELGDLVRRELDRAQAEGAETTEAGSSRW